MKGFYLHVLFHVAFNKKKKTACWGKGKTYIASQTGVLLPSSVEGHHPEGREHRTPRQSDWKSGSLEGGGKGKHYWEKHSAHLCIPHVVNSPTIEEFACDPTRQSLLFLTAEMATAGQS